MKKAKRKCLHFCYYKTFLLVSNITMLNFRVKYVEEELARRKGITMEEEETESG